MSGAGFDEPICCNQQMKKGQNTSLTIAIAVTIMTALLFLFLFLFLGINHRKDLYKDSQKLASEISRNAAIETQKYISSAINEAWSLEKQARTIRKLNGSRKEIYSILMNSIQENRNYLGVWTLWEPGAFDGKDYLFVDDTLYNDEGTLGIGLFRFHDSTFYEVMTKADYKGPHYIAPQQLLDEIVIDPYKFVYSGYEQVFFGTTVSIPIIYNNKFLGAIGIDIDLNKLSEELNQVRPYKTGYLSLISSNGTIVTHLDSSFLNKNIFNILAPQDTLAHNAILKGEHYTFETISEFTGQKVFRVFYPISIGKSKNPWSMMVEIPVKEINSRSKEILLIAIITLALGLSLLVYLIFNITDRKRYEKVLLNAKSRAEESDRLKTAFLRNISHEIRTPLNGLLGFAEIISNIEIKDNRVNFYKEKIRESSDQLLSTITNVMELSKIQSQQGELNIKEFDIERAINQVVDNYRDLSYNKGLRIVDNYSSKFPGATITADEEKFKQVISFLLSNAIKFTDSGFVEIGYYARREVWMFYIFDTGIGIQSDKVQSIFEAFTKGSLSLNGSYEGLGIGLSIAKSFVEMMKGRIMFDSEVGKGSTFCFFLPTSHKDYALSEELLIPLQIDFPILAIKDGKQRKIVYEQLLSKTRSKLLWACNEKEARDLIKSNDNIKIVFVDVQLFNSENDRLIDLLSGIRNDIHLFGVINKNDKTIKIPTGITFDSIIEEPFKQQDLVKVFKMIDNK